MIFSALIELHQSQHEFLDLMKQQGHTLLEAVITSSSNTLLTNEYLENFLEEKLLHSASFIRYLYERNQIDNDFLKTFARDNAIFRINIFNRNGAREYSNHNQGVGRFHRQSSPGPALAPIFKGEQDTLIIGFKEAQHEAGYRFAVALAARNRSAIVLNLDAEEILQFRRRIGFGALLKDLAVNPGVVFIALQDSAGIIAASGNVAELDRIVDDPFLTRSFRATSFDSRIAVFNGADILEIVHPFNYEGMHVGLFRLGISLEPLHLIRARIIRRLIIITVILVAVGFVFFAFIMARQQFNLLQKQYQVVETFSGNIIHNVSDAIIVSDDLHGIKMMNASAEKIFQKDQRDAIGKPASFLFKNSAWDAGLDPSSPLAYLECTIAGSKKYLLASRGRFIDENETENTILVIRDLTHQQKLEAQLQRKERLTAMGELASGVAHEIRNPLNTIGTIIQQLKKDFQPTHHAEEYDQLSQLVYQEVQRINQTISDFLKFAQPQPVHPEPFRLGELFDDLKIQYNAMFNQNRIGYSFTADWDGEVIWDRAQMRQVFMNLLQNAVDAIKTDGAIAISVHRINDQELDIQVRDNGQGIPESQLAKIFNLYFTTKAKGAGIGLSIVQRIIIEHGGLISVESESGKGATFIIHMPIHFG